MQTSQTIGLGECLTLIFPGDQVLPETGPLLFCKVDPLGEFPVLRVEWDPLAKEWKTTQFNMKEKTNEPVGTNE